PDEGRALDQVIEETLGKAGLSLDREAATLLKASLGTDRAATRGELEKLSLYAAGTGTVTAEDVAAVVTDAAPSSLDEWLDAMCLSQAEKALAALDRALESGIQPVAIGLAFQRHIMTLHRLAIDIADGKSARGVVDGTRPPIFFRRKAAFTGALERLSETRLRALIKDARTLDLDLRRSPETATARLTLMTLRISRLTRR
ncbi:MAG: DNA polymerase III subunit delta, partial [Hyphomicrobiaceae bacterium]|nr:DNA polymerase III subunit delta [Hyphomicrobiaceae bacterium]